MTPKLFRAQEVCDIAQVQPYVLRSWEKEFPGIGVQKSADSPRLYRQADVDQVLLIKRLVFSEGLTLAGARRKLEDTVARTPAAVDHDVVEVLDALATDARTRIAYVKDGLRSILRLLSHAPGTIVVIDDVHVNGARPPARTPAAVRAMPQRTAGNTFAKAPAKSPAKAPSAKAPAKASAAARPAKTFGKAKPATMKAASSKAAPKATGRGAGSAASRAKRSRASA
jgi:DNA-binding transcriptional MerR regulator